MTIVLDHLDVFGKRALITSAATIGIVLSHLTIFGRIWAKLGAMGRLQSDDWFMLTALLFSYPIFAMQFYGMAHGLGEHEEQLLKTELRKMNFSIWIIQRFQPPAIFCLKTSIILLYVRIFDTPMFRKVAWGIWIYTLIWMIEAWNASLFECWPIAYFWNKTIKGGHCVPKPLTNIGFSNGFISFVGDLFILLMPLPMVWKLQMNLRNKVALTLVFLLGLFVVGTSIIRLIALFTINSKDVSFTQVQAGVFTYLEISIGITCGNLPLLRPLLRRFLDKTGRTLRGSHPKLPSNNTSSYARGTGLGSRVPTSQTGFRNNGFERMGNDVESVGETSSDVELQERRYQGKGIQVQKDVELIIQSEGSVLNAQGGVTSGYTEKGNRDRRDPMREPVTRSNVTAHIAG